MTISDIKAFIERNYLKNRTVVSRDIALILADMEKMIGIPMKRHAYKSGEEHGTWVVPPSWDVNEAWLKDEAGNTVASYKDHPLFISPFSSPVREQVSKEELLSHIVFEPTQPDAFQYNWRYALDSHLRLKDWGLSLPKNIVDSLSDGPFEVCIDARVEDGEMIVGEWVLEGERSESILFIADYCHPGQVNDSFSGLAMFMRVITELAKVPNRKYTYRFLVMPETIGSAVHIASDPTRFENAIGGIFSEMIAWGDEWFLKASRVGDKYIDTLAADARRIFPEAQHSDFCSLYRNDELMFDSVQVGIPTLSLQKHPFAEYHTSNDEPSRIQDSELQKAHDIIMHMVDVLERDAVYSYAHPVPVWMTRYDLHVGSKNEKLDYSRKYRLNYCLLDGSRSLLQVANELDCSFEDIYEYVQSMHKNGLIRRSEVRFTENEINKMVWNQDQRSLSL
jgi:aminopeptidase-like protein